MTAKIDMHPNAAAESATHSGRPVLRAAVWMLGSIGAFTAMAVSGRAVSANLDTFELMFYRSVIGIVLVLAAGWASNSLHTITTRRFHLQVLRNVSHFTGQNLWFWALTVIPLSQLISLEFTQPIWVLLLATLVLGERFTLFKLVVVTIGFGGALLVARPDFAALDPGALAAAGAAIGFAGSTVMTKMLTRTESVICILFWLVGLQALFGLVTAGYDGDLALPTAANLPWLLVLGASGLLAHMCLTKALMLAPATVVIPFDFLRLPVLTIVGYFFYAEGIDALVIIGASLILLANLINLRNRG